MYLALAMQLYATYIILERILRTATRPTAALSCMGLAYTIVLVYTCAGPALSLASGMLASAAAKLSIVKTEVAATETSVDVASDRVALEAQLIACCVWLNLLRATGLRAIASARVEPAEVALAGAFVLYAEYERQSHPSHFAHDTLAKFFVLHTLKCTASLTLAMLAPWATVALAPESKHDAWIRRVPWSTLSRAAEVSVLLTPVYYQALARERFSMPEWYSVLFVALYPALAQLSRATVDAPASTHIGDANIRAKLIPEFVRGVGPLIRAPMTLARLQDDEPSCNEGRRDTPEEEKDTKVVLRKRPKYTLGKRYTINTRRVRVAPLLPSTGLESDSPDVD